MLRRCQRVGQECQQRVYLRLYFAQACGAVHQQANEVGLAVGLRFAGDAFDLRAGRVQRDLKLFRGGFHCLPWKRAAAMRASVSVKPHKLARIFGFVKRSSSGSEMNIAAAADGASDRSIGPGSGTIGTSYARRPDGLETAGVRPWAWPLRPEGMADQRIFSKGSGKAGGRRGQTFVRPMQAVALVEDALGGAVEKNQSALRIKQDDGPRQAVQGAGTGVQALFQTGDAGVDAQRAIQMRRQKPDDGHLWFTEGAGLVGAGRIFQPNVRRAVMFGIEFLLVRVYANGFGDTGIAVAEIAHHERGGRAIDGGRELPQRCTMVGDSEKEGRRGRRDMELSGKSRHGLITWRMPDLRAFLAIE